jgi:hypothetical protein
MFHFTHMTFVFTMLLLGKSVWSAVWGKSVWGI